MLQILATASQYLVNNICNVRALYPGMEELLPPLHFCHLIHLPLVTYWSQTANIWRNLKILKESPIIFLVVNFKMLPLLKGKATLDEYSREEIDAEKPFTLNLDKLLSIRSNNMIIFQWMHRNWILRLKAWRLLEASWDIIAMFFLYWLLDKKVQKKLSPNWSKLQSIWFCSDKQ